MKSNSVLSVHPYIQVMLKYWQCVFYPLAVPAFSIVCKGETVYWATKYMLVRKRDLKSQILPSYTKKGVQEVATCVLWHV